MIVRKAERSNVEGRSRVADLDRLGDAVVAGLLDEPLAAQIAISQASGILVALAVEPEWFDPGASELAYSSAQTEYAASLLEHLTDHVKERLRRPARERPLIPEREPMTLGELIKALEKRPRDERVRFDFADYEPTDLRSYRGDYSHAALGWRERAGDGVTAGLFRGMLRESIGQDLEGWKGPGGKIGSSTPVWVANSAGDCTHTALVGLVDHEGETVLATAFCG